jgi:hypothetical protein
MQVRIAAAAVALICSCAPVDAAPVDAIRAGDMKQMIPEIIAIYEDAGLSWRHTIEWQIGPFTTTYWYYSFATDEVVVGAVPTGAEVGAYWQTWSDVLTDGSFDPEAFFASDDEARELAHYNQFVLATHESAHAMTYRYDYAHLDRHDDPGVNCREYYADRLTIGILNELAVDEPDMKRWRDRYRDLVTAMGDAIPERYRYRIADYATLDADCAVIEVAQPTPETMQPYASAYFERYRVLLEADLPPMADLFETHLQARHDAKLADEPLAPEYDRVRASTLGELPPSPFGNWSGEDFTIQYSRAAGFDPQGTLWFATVRYDTEAQTIGVSFGSDPEVSPVITEPAHWDFPSRRVRITSTAVLSPDRFFFTLDHWDASGPGGAERQFTSYVYARRQDGVWEIARLLDAEGVAQGAVLRSPEGRLFVLGTPDAPSNRPSTNWGGFEMSPQTFDVLGELAIGQPLEFPVAIDESGRLYQDRYGRLWRTSPSELVVFAGDGLGGARDGLGDYAKFWDVDVLQWMSDDRALFLDSNRDLSGWLIREFRIE